MTRKTFGGPNTPVAINEIVEGVVVPITTTAPIDVTIPTDAPLTVTQIGTGGVDAFARQRFSQPATLFDSKQIFDNSLGAGNENQPLFWDNQATVGSGTSSTYSRNRASTTLAVSDQTAGTRVRQTRRRFNYLPGKSQLYILTFSNLITGAGITKRIGGYDGTNGIFLQHANGVAAFGVRSYVTGTAVDTLITQANWSLDTMDGNGPSGITLDFNKSQIFFYDYEWLGVGRVRLGFFVDGTPYYAHEFLHTNILVPVYMSTPNTPVRAEIINDGTGSADTFEVICASVVSEGGQERLGMYRTIPPNTWATNIINANTVGTTYAVGGIRLKTTHLGLTVDITSIIGIATTSDDYILSLHFNPTLSAAPSFANVAESGLQYALGATSNPGTTLTDPGYTLMSRVISTDVESINIAVENAVRLGANIASTPDEIWLAVTPLGANLDILGVINWQEQL